MSKVRDYRPFKIIDDFELDPPAGLPKIAGMRGECTVPMRAADFLVDEMWNQLLAVLKIPNGFIARGSMSTEEMSEMIAAGERLRAALNKETAT